MIFRSAVVLGVLLVAAGSAYAYVDPGTGSYLLQTLAAGILAALFVVKCFWRNIKEKVLGIFGKRQ